MNRRFPPSSLAMRRVALAAVLAVAAGCGRKSAPPPEVTPADSAARAESLAAAAIPPPPPPVGYTRALVRSPSVLFALRDSLGEALWREVLRVNRVDSAHVRRGDTLIVPRAARDSLALSPFPLVFAAARDTARALLVSLRVQAFGAYDHGRLTRWGPVSSGRREMPTPAGLYHVNWKDRERVSTFSDEWLLEWCLNIQNFEGVSLHLYELPGRPASHSCVRLAEDDAMALYAWAGTWEVAADGRTILRPGTPVVVFGEWAWKQRAPWKRLPEDSTATTLSEAEIAEAARVMTTGQRPKFVNPPPVRAPRDSITVTRADSLPG